MKITAEFKIPYYHYLSQDGKLKENPAIQMDHELLKRYYRNMILVQQFDKKAIALQRTGKMGTYAPITDQEALGTAIGLCLERDDVFIPYYRDYATMYLRGVPLSDVLLFWGGDERASRFSLKSHDFPFCVPIASQCLHAAGVAFALKYKKSKQIALVTLGDGATSEGDFYEAINLAAVWDLPIVFVILNNRWAISVPYEQQTRCQTLAQKAIAAGMQGIQVDGNDVFALHSVLTDAIAQARGPNAKPILIEALSYRLSDHTTADDASRYQPSAEVEQAKQFTPIPRLEAYLIAEKILNQNDMQHIVQECQNEVEEIVAAYMASSTPNIRQAFDYHYAEMPEELIEQRAEAIEEFEHAHA